MKFWQSKEEPPSEPVLEPPPPPSQTDINAQLITGLSNIAAELVALKADATPSPLPLPPVTSSAPPPIPIPEVTITPETISEALDNGDTRLAEALRTQQYEQIAARAAAQAVTPIQQAGFNAITALAQSQAETALPLYNRFKSEITTELNNLPAEMQSQPGMHKKAYELVIGAHQAELQQEAVTAALAAAQQIPTTPTPNDTAGSLLPGSPTMSTTVNPTDVLSQDELQFLSTNELTPDTFAQRLGYATFNEYHTQAIAPYQKQNKIFN